MNLRIQAQKLKNAYEKSFEDIRSKYNLTMNEIMLLHYLYKHQDKDTSKDFGEFCFATKSHVSKSVDNMVERGYISKILDNQDKKSFHLTLKNDAISIVEKINSRNEEITNRVTKGVSKEELDEINRIFNLILKNIEEMENEG